MGRHPITETLGRAAGIAARAALEAAVFWAVFKALGM